MVSEKSWWRRFPKCYVTQVLPEVPFFLGGKKLRRLSVSYWEQQIKSPNGFL
jgi:hypothetical protein